MRSRPREAGQAFIETVLMIWLLTLLFSAIVQVFLVHNYAYQMANNAYYSLFKDKAYGEYNHYDREFQGFPNFQKKPLRAVTPLQQAGGKVHVLAGPDVNWSSDDRAAVPMMPFFEDAIIEQLQNNGISRAPVRLKIGNRVPGHNYLDMKYLWMGMGTEGGFKPFFGMIESIFKIAEALGHDPSSYTGGYSQDELDDLYGDYEGKSDEMNNQDPNGGQNAKDQWDEAHGDFNHDGYHDACETLHGNNASQCKNDRPWE